MKEWQTQRESPPKVETPLETLAESSPLRPIRRPVYPRLILLDEGSDEAGETVRIRTDALTLGRTNGDLSFPAETLMSGKHARISLSQTTPGSWSWTLDDLSSRHGVFIRLSEFLISPGNEFLLGGTKLVVHGDMAVTRDFSAGISSFEPYFATPNSIRKKPELEVQAYQFSQETSSIPMTKRKMNLGRVGIAEAFFSVDPFVEPEHAVLTRDEKRGWQVRDLDSLNGVWLRVSRAFLSSKLEFLLGEQRFRFELPAPF